MKYFLPTLSAWAPLGRRARHKLRGLEREANGTIIDYSEDTDFLFKNELGAIHHTSASELIDLEVKPISLHTLQKLPDEIRRTYNHAPWIERINHDP